MILEIHKLKRKYYSWPDAVKMMFAGYSIAQEHWQSDCDIYVEANIIMYRDSLHSGEAVRQWHLDLYNDPANRGYDLWIIRDRKNKEKS